MPRPDTTLNQRLDNALAALRSRVEASSLCDAPRYTRHWERLLRCMSDR